MKNIDAFKILKENNIEEVKRIIETEGKYKVLSLFSEFLDKRAYFSVDKNGDIIRKQINPVFLIFPYEDDIDKLATAILKYSDARERVKISKIDRFSNKTIEDLEANLMKTTLKGNLDFSKSYAKELFLRDEDSFYKIINTMALMSDISSQKALVALSFRKIMSKLAYDERIFYIFMSFMTKYRDDFHAYENAKLNSNTAAQLEEVEVLSAEAIAYKKLLNTYDYKNKNKFYDVLNEIKDYKNDETNFLMEIIK